MKEVELYSLNEYKSSSNSHPGKKWVPLSKRSYINPLWIFAICANQITMSFIWITNNTLTNPYCKKLGLSTFSTTCIQSIGSIGGIFVAPLAAAWSDSTNFRYGRRRIFLVLGEVFVLSGFVLMSFCREMTSSREAAVRTFLVGQIFAMSGGNFANGPGRAMCSDVVPPTQQVLVSSICMMDNSIAGVVANLIGALKLYKYTSLNNETFVLIVSCALGLFALIVSVVATPEEQFNAKQARKNPFALAWQSFRAVDKNLFFVIMAFMVYAIGSVEFIILTSNYIARYVFHGVPNAPDGIYDDGVSFAQLLSLIQTVFQTFYSFFNTRIINKLGFNKGWTFGMICVIIGNVLINLISNKYLLVIPYLFIGISHIVANALPLAYASLVSSPENLAGCITLFIIFSNIGYIAGMFLLTIGFGSFPWFAENPSRIISISSIFIVFAIILGRKGYKNIPTNESALNF